MIDRVAALLVTAVVLTFGALGTVFASVADSGAAATAIGFGTAAIGLFTLMFNTYRKEIRRLTVKCARSERVNDILLTTLYANNIPVPEEVRVLQGLSNGASRGRR